MCDIKLLIERASNNNNILLERDLYDLDLTEEEYIKIISELKSNKIKIENEDELALDIYLKDSEKYYLYEIARYKLLSPEEERILLIKCKDGDEESRQQLINSNLRLVASIAIKCKKSQNIEGIDLLDLMQEGTFGLMDSIDTFDFTKGVKLSTYATWCIKKYIFLAIKNNNRVIRVSAKEQEKFNKLLAYKDELTNYLGCNYTRLVELINNNQNVISYDVPLSEFESMTLREIIPSKDNLEEQIINKIYFEDLWKKLKDILTEREYNIILMRCGKKIGSSGSYKPQTLWDIAKLLNISAERVRVIESDAIQKINRKIKRYR